jgi:hypothetical protein
MSALNSSLVRVFSKDALQNLLADLASTFRARLPDYNTLDAPGLFLLIAVNNFVATVAALLALIGRKWKAQAKATILLQSAAGAGAVRSFLPRPFRQQ